MKATMLLLLLGLAAVLIGCSGDTTIVEGRVTLDGEPLNEGKIRFEPADGKGPTAEVIVRDGQYRVELTPGSKKVMIEGWRTIGQQQHDPNDPSSPLVDVKEAIVPERYNRNTELTYQAQGSDTKDFALSTQ